MKRRYIPIRIVWHPEGGGTRNVRVLDGRGRRIEGLIPDSYAAAFYRSKPGTRIKADIHYSPHRIRRRRARPKTLGRNWIVDLLRERVLLGVRRVEGSPLGQ